MPDRRTPFVRADERDTLVAFLDYLRESVAIKASGVSDAAARRALVPSGTSLLGLVRHLTTVELSWFQWSFAGIDVRFPPAELEPQAQPSAVIDEYRAVTRRNNEIVAAEPDLARPCARNAVGEDALPLRWVLVHMIEETARHAGHADILRELIDGETGR